MRLSHVCAVILIVVSVSNARQIVEWSRKLDTCDAEDRALTQGTTRFIYSFNDARPADADSLKPHGPANRGTQSARLFEKSHARTPLPPDADYFDVLMPRVNVTFFPQSPDTAYWCTGYKLPEFNETVHVVRWEPVLQEDNLDVLHHMVVTECLTMEESDVGFNGECGYASSEFPRRMIECLGGTTIGAWAVGGGPMDLPLHTGLPLIPGQLRYLFIQVHYNRVDMHRRPVVDSSGMRFWYTKQLRKEEAGVFAVGMITSPQYKIPPGQKAYTYEASCPGACTEQFPQPIKLVSTLLHAHNIGSALSVRHWRKGQEQPQIISDPNYDFNFQDFEHDAAGTVIYPGDEIHVTCTYDSTERSEETRFGLSSQEEMCIAYILYWPRIKQNSGCMTGFKDKAQTQRFAYCLGQNHDYTFDHQQPLPPVPCTHTAVDPARQKPKMMPLSEFDLTKYNRSIVDTVNGRDVKVYWSINERTSEVHFAADVDTDGWFGVGLSKNGGMPGSDIMTAHVFKNSTGHWVPVVRDRIATAYARPQVDVSQDLYDIRISFPQQ